MSIVREFLNTHLGPTSVEASLAPLSALVTTSLLQWLAGVNASVVEILEKCETSPADASLNGE